MQKSRQLILFDIDYTLFDTDQLKRTDLKNFSLYKNVRQTLTQLGKVADLGIFSEGNLDFQLKKLHTTKIHHYFATEHIHIVDKKLEAIENLAQKYKTHKNIFLVDDRLTIFPGLKNKLPNLFLIWMRKKSGHEDYQTPLEGFYPDAEIDTLEEVIPLITNRQV